MNVFSKLRSRFDATKTGGTDFLSARQNLLSDPSVSANEKTLLKKVILEIHPNDGMYQGNAHHYLSVGLSAIRCIENALEKANADKSVQSILDFPCGYGRVLRFLRVRFPEAEISASELDSNMLDFCTVTFHVNPIKSDPDFNKISVPNKFDLIWCGSLMTHITEAAASNLLEFFYNHLSPNGVCVFTAHGQFTIELIQNGASTYGIPLNGQNEIVSQFYRTGYGYADYWNQHYGISAVSHSRMSSLAQSIGDWKEIFFAEQGWDHHQDVYGFAIAVDK